MHERYIIPWNDFHFIPIFQSKETIKFRISSRTTFQSFPTLKITGFFKIINLLRVPKSKLSKIHILIYILPPRLFLPSWVSKTHFKTSIYVRIDKKEKLAFNEQEPPVGSHLDHSYEVMTSSVILKNTFRVHFNF